MKRAIIILFIFVAVPAVAQNNPGLYTKYRKAISDGKYKQARKELNKISNEVNNSYINLLLIGQLYGMEGKLDSAEVYLDRALAYYAEHPISFKDSEFKNVRDSLYKVSIDVYDKIIKVQPNSKNYRNRGAFKCDIKNYQDAIIDFKYATKLNSTACIAYYNLGLTYRRINQLDSALIYYDKAIECRPYYNAAHNNKGFIYIRLDSFNMAINEFQKSLELTDKNNSKGRSYILNNMGYSYYKLGNYQLAKELITKSVNLHSINSYAYKNLALLNIAMGNMKDACEAVDKAIELGFVNLYGSEILMIKKENCDN